MWRIGSPLAPGMTTQNREPTNRASSGRSALIGPSARPAATPWLGSGGPSRGANVDAALPAYARPTVALGSPVLLLVAHVILCLSGVYEILPRIDVPMHLLGGVVAAIFVAGARAR